MTLRISFSGAARAGKDTAAETAIKLRDGLNVKFAERLYDATKRLYEYVGIPFSKDRELLQFIGSWARTHDDQTWLRPVMTKIADNPETNLYVSDARYRNELSMLKEQGFVLVKINRKDLPDPNAEWRKHASEVDLNSFDGWDYELENCDNRQHYEENVALLLQLIDEGRHLQQPRMTIKVS